MITKAYLDKLFDSIVAENQKAQKNNDTNAIIATNAKMELLNIIYTKVLEG